MGLVLLLKLECFNIMLLQYMLKHCVQVGSLRFSNISQKICPHAMNFQKMLFSNYLFTNKPTCTNQHVEKWT